MNKKEMFYFNKSGRSNQFLNSFRPSSTPGTSFVSPGLSNSNIYTVFVKSHFNTPPLVYQKETKEEIGKTHFVQEGKGAEDQINYNKPIEVDRTLLEGLIDDDDNTAADDDNEKSKDVEMSNQNETTLKRKKPIKKISSKKSKLSFKILD